jgi:hypothetical protein
VMATTADLFGASNSDDALRLESWLSVMCRGCVKDRGRAQSGSDMGGMGCRLPADAYADPDADIPDWSADAAPRPERLNELSPGPWPVCLAWRPRKTRSDAGIRRGPQVPAGQGALL